MPVNQFYNAFDLERLDSAGSEQDYRSPFQIDRDRIIHTPAFRRLQSKTQVFSSGQFDVYRTRLTHSLEVAQIGRSICNYLLHSSDFLTREHYIDPELVEAACLAHDLGHPPFGHAGERTLNQLMKSSGGFEGNAQTLRLLTETIFDSSGRGMNPTRAFLDATLKYKTLHGELDRPNNHFIYTEQFRFLDFALGGHDFPIEAAPGKLRDQMKSIECQIMDWADDTAYSLNDIADGIQCGFLNIERIEAWAHSKGTLTPNQDAAINQLLQSIRDRKVESHLGRRIGDYIQATTLDLDSNFLSDTTNRYRYHLKVDPSIKEECDLLKDLAYRVIFLSPTLKQLEHKAHFMLERLFATLAQSYLQQDSEDSQKFRLLPDRLHRAINETEDQKIRSRLICDHLASLTDHQATRLYQRLFSPDSGSIIDLMN